MAKRIQYCKVKKKQTNKQKKHHYAPIKTNKQQQDTWAGPSEQSFKRQGPQLDDH